jgi:hypothetical protein
MKRIAAFGGLLVLAGCGGGSTVGTNYSEAPPQAEIVATPSPAPSESATPEAAAPAEAPAEAVANETAAPRERRFENRPVDNSPVGNSM